MMWTCKFATLALAWCRAHGVNASLAIAGCPPFDGAIVAGWCLSMYAKVRAWWRLLGAEREEERRYAAVAALRREWWREQKVVTMEKRSERAVELDRMLCKETPGTSSKTVLEWPAAALVMLAEEVSEPDPRSQSLPRALRR